MEIFKISRNGNPVVSTVPLKFGDDDLALSGGSVCLKLKKSEANGLCENGRLHLVKYSSGSSAKRIKVCEDDVLIGKIVEDNEYSYIYFEYTYIKPLTLASFIRISSSSSGCKYKLTFTTNTDISPVDFVKYSSVTNSAYTVYVKNNLGGIVAFEGLELCYPGELWPGKTSIVTGNDCTESQKTCFNYETMEKNSVLAKTKIVIDSDFTPSPGDQVFFCINPYYFSVASDDPSESPRVILLNNTARSGDCYSRTNVYIEKYTDFQNLEVVLEQDYDSKRMFQEYQVNELFVRKIKDSVIPGFIDLEKVKYAPAFTTEGREDSSQNVFLATGLTFNLHFRSREQKITGTNETDKYVFEDTWYLNDSVSGWNGNGFSDRDGNLDIVYQNDLYSDENFVNSSNLIGYLDFTDDDVYNQKNRVKRSFLRLSFYDGYNPLTQNLLYYSTIFMDSGDLYGKYVKRRAMLEGNDPEYDSNLNPVVWSPTAETDTVSAVTSQLIVNDEYDTARSSEGFNLYLFRQDAPLENQARDIYMKVEFNHAGNGRTIPFIFWKKENTESTKPIDLTVENYMENLYIHMKISLTDRGYIYSFPDITETDAEDPSTRCNGILWENERIVFNLFEPRITPPDFSDLNQGN